MEKGYNRTNLYIINEKLWKWAKFQANTLGKTSVSEYLFDLIQIDYIKENIARIEKEGKNNG